MSEQPTYVVVKGCIRRPRVAGSGRTFVNRGDFINQGEVLPEGLYSEADIAGWLKEGRIQDIDLDAQTAAVVAETIKARGKWTVDPSTLAGKSMDEMLIMVMEIDENCDEIFEDEASLVRHLTQDWSPEYNAIVPAASDRSKPQALALNKLEQSESQGATSTGTPEMSAKAKEALDEARRRADAPKDVVEPAEQPSKQLNALERARAKAGKGPEVAVDPEALDPGKESLERETEVVAVDPGSEDGDETVETPAEAPSESQGDEQPSLEPNAVPEARVSLDDAETPSDKE